jgi:hypothetical protein
MNTDRLSSPTQQLMKYAVTMCKHYLGMSNKMEMNGQLQLPSAFIHREHNTTTHWAENWMVLKSVLDMEVKINISTILARN